jgi:potassium channel subfamily K
VATKRAEYKKLKETQRTRKHAIERMLNNAGLPTYIDDPLRPTKKKLNEEALTPAQLSAADNEALHVANRRVNRNGLWGDGNRIHRPMFERTFSLESNVTDLYSNAQFAENNYKNFKLGIIREERREFAAKVCPGRSCFIKH